MQSRQVTAPLSHAPETELVAAVADLVASHRVRGTALDDLPEALRPPSYEPVEHIMLALHRRLPWTTVGWKVGAASEEVQKLERLPGPVPGRLFERGLYHSGDTVPASALINHRNTECEFAFMLTEDLPARAEEYTVEEVSAVLGDLVPVLEIGDSVFPNWYDSSLYYGPCLDNGGGAALVLGTPVSDWRDEDLASAPIDQYLNGEFRRRGLGSAAMGNPVASLTWMANWTSSYGIDLLAGEILSSGTCTSHCFAAPGDRITADFGRFGLVEITYEMAEEPS